jgi:hypothetical protein
VYGPATESARPGRWWWLWRVARLAGRIRRRPGRLPATGFNRPEAGRPGERRAVAMQQGAQDRSRRSLDRRLPTMNLKI